ncbi:MAG: hypothetical protein ACR2PB_13510 [Desulfocapsaceae bacterium]
MNRNLIKSIVASALILLLLPAIGLSADYQSMSTKDLSDLRGTMYNAPQEERDAFRVEWRERIDRMTPEEKEKYLGAGGGRGKGNRTGDGLGDGTGKGRGGGMGSMNSNGVGQGNGQGAGQGARTQ